MKFLVLVPDGVAIRNFFCSRFVDLLLSEGEVLVWHALPEPSVAPHRQRWGDSVRWEILPGFREGLPERVLRQAKMYAQLYWNYDRDDSDAVLKFLRPSGRLVNRALTFSARNLGRICGSERGVVWLDRRHARATVGADYFGTFETFLEHEQPDIVFCTHQRISRAVPAMLAARSLGIPTATFIYSWDNLPKGRMAVHADYFLVWSEFMKEELLRYHPEVTAERVHVVGTPQFEHYFDTELLKPRDEFIRSLGLDPSRPVVCFSGDDTATSPHDPLYLADLARALRKLPERERPQILFRRCPVDTSNRYQSVLEEFPEITISDPLWLSQQNGDWTQAIPTREDIALLANVVNHCDLVINVGSTMAMDFAVFDKPGIYLAYDHPSANGGWSVKDTYRLPHLRPVHELQPVYWAYSATELGTLIDHALSHAEEKGEARRAWLEKQIMHPLDQASTRCHQALRRIVAPDLPR